MPRRRYQLDQARTIALIAALLTFLVVTDASADRIWPDSSFDTTAFGFLHGFENDTFWNEHFRLYQYVPPSPSNSGGNRRLAKRAPAFGFNGNAGWTFQDGPDPDSSDEPKSLDPKTDLEIGLTDDSPPEFSDLPWSGGSGGNLPYHPYSSGEVDLGFVDPGSGGLFGPDSSLTPLTEPDVTSHVDPNSIVTPEPGSLALLGSGLLVFCRAVSRRRNQKP
jgi:hypothetical protein